MKLEGFKDSMHGVEDSFYDGIVAQALHDILHIFHSIVLFLENCDIKFPSVQLMLQLYLNVREREAMVEENLFDPHLSRVLLQNFVDLPQIPINFYGLRVHVGENNVDITPWCPQPCRIRAYNIDMKVHFVPYFLQFVINVTKIIPSKVNPTLTFDGISLHFFGKYFRVERDDFLN